MCSSTARAAIRSAHEYSHACECIHPASLLCFPPPTGVTRGCFPASVSGSISSVPIRRQGAGTYCIPSRSYRSQASLLSLSLSLFLVVSLLPSFCLSLSPSRVMSRCKKTESEVLRRDGERKRGAAHGRIHFSVRK